MNFTRQPFQYDVDTDFFFPGGARGDIVEEIITALSSGVPLVTLTGTDGAGKTMVCRKVVEDFGEDHQILFFEQGVESFDKVIEGVLSLAGVDDDDSAVDRKLRFEKVVETMKEEKRRLVLVIDGAELIFLATLERIRSMVDLANDDDTTIQLVLSGQPLFLLNFKQLGIVSFQDVEERNFSLDPLDAETTFAYLNHCIEVGTGITQDFFSLRMADRIMDTARGNFRLINQLADRFVTTGSLTDPETDAFDSAQDDDEPLVSVEENGRIHTSTRNDNVDLDFLKIPRLKYQWYVAAAAAVGLILVLFLLIGGNDEPVDVPPEAEKVPDLTLEEVEPDPIEIPDTADQPIPVIVAPQAPRITEEETAIVREPPPPEFRPREEVVPPPPAALRNTPEPVNPEGPPAERPEMVQREPAVLKPEESVALPVPSVPPLPPVTPALTDQPAPEKTTVIPDIGEPVSQPASDAVDEISTGPIVAAVPATEDRAIEELELRADVDATGIVTPERLNPVPDPEALPEGEPELQPVSVEEPEPETELTRVPEPELEPELEPVLDLEPVIASPPEDETEIVPESEPEFPAIAVAADGSAELGGPVREGLETESNEISEGDPVGELQEMAQAETADEPDLTAVSSEGDLVAEASLDGGPMVAASAPIPEEPEREIFEPVVTSESIQIPELTVVTRKKQHTEIAPFSVVTLKEERKRLPEVAVPAPLPKPVQVVPAPEPRRAEPLPAPPSPPDLTAPVVVSAPNPPETTVRPDAVASIEQKTPVEAAVQVRQAPKPQNTRAYYSERLAAGSRWLVGGGSGKYTVKLTVFQSEQAERSLGDMLNESGYQSIKDRTYLLRKASQPQTVTLYFGEFDSQEEARRAQQGLPQFLQDMNPSALAVNEAVSSVRSSQ